jgi:hypothetical protein
MAVVRSYGHELSKSGFVIQPEHSPFADEPLLNASRFSTDRSDLVLVDERPTMCQKLIHDMLGGSPLAVGENFRYSHPNEIVPSRHDKDSQQGDIEDSDPLIPVIEIQTRLTNLPLHRVKMHLTWGEGVVV